MAHKITISAPGCIMLAAGLLLVPLRWFLAALLAAAIHECCHILAISLCGGRIFHLQIGATGITLLTERFTGWRGAVCAMSGPAGALLLLPLYRWCPRLVFCGMAQSLWNLLPVYPLDGGRALRCILESVLPERVRNWVEWAVAVPLLTIFLCLTWKLHLYLPAFFAFFLLVRKIILQSRLESATIGLLQKMR